EFPLEYCPSMARAYTHDTRQPFYKRVAGPLFFAFALFYLGFHAVSGERGVLALFRESRKLEILQAQLEASRAERASLELKVRGMSNDSLDLDLLDEQARSVLGYASKNEVVYFLPKLPRN